ncbi:hypothetical protein ACF0H5_006264 [Mactra antiquata]
MFLLCLICLLPLTECLSVGTYNLWNIMFNWQTRKLRIVEMIKDLEVDVIAVQEVRSGYDYNSTNQILELKSQLSSKYKWHVYKVANNVTFVDRTIDKMYPGEGIGVISRLPVLSSSVQYLLPHPRDPDKNKRIILHVKIQDTNNVIYNIIIIHLSYYRQQQCRNVEDIITFIHRNHLQNVIILGDFNTYNDYDWPIRLLTDDILKPSNQCWREINNKQYRSNIKFHDAWTTVHLNDKGLTFSNMPSPGMESRPDRILVESSLKIEDIKLLGDGFRYKRRYTGLIHWSRFISIIQSVYLSYQGVEGYSCLHDCGPHGSCICGVCVAIGNQDGCLLPDCDICNKEKFVSIISYLILFFVIFLHLCYSVIVIMTVGSNNYGDTLYSILGWKCCLFNPRLCKVMTVTHRQRYKCLKLCKYWPIFRLPPYLQFVLYTIFLVIFYFYCKHTFQPIINITYNVLDEEFFPSDHMFVVAYVQTSKR